MSKKTKTTIGIIIVILLVVGGLLMLGRKTASPRAPGTSGINSLLDKPAPQFALQDLSGTSYTNESLKGKNVILFFNEGIMCYPACWNQMVALANDTRFSTPETVALSVVVDPPSSWQGAIQKMPELGAAKVLFDTDKSASNAFGMLTRDSSMHYGMLPGHSFVLIDKDGIVRYTLDDPNMAIDNDKVAAELQKLN